MIVYADASALRMLVIEEPGSQRAELLWSHACVVASAVITYAEVGVELAALRRGGMLDEVRHEQAIGAFDELWSQVSVVTVDGSLARRAVVLAEQRGLAAAEAVHLAAAERVGALVMMTVDHDLSRSARELGLHAMAGAEGSRSIA